LVCGLKACSYRFKVLRQGSRSGRGQVAGVAGFEGCCDVEMVAFAGVIGRGFSLIAAGGGVRSVFEEQGDDCGVAVGGGLMERGIASGLGGVDVGSGFEEEAEALDGVAEGDAGVEGLVAHGVVGDLVNVGSVLEEEFYGLGGGEGGGEVQGRPSVGGDGAGDHGVGCDQDVEAVTVAEGGGFVDIAISGVSAEEIADERLMGVDGPHERGDALGIAAAGEVRGFLDGSGDLGGLSPADHVEEELAHGMSIRRLRAGSLKAGSLKAGWLRSGWLKCGQRTSG
jgi:hypothetical protein